MLRISRSVSATVRGSIGKRDVLILGQECSKRQRSSRLSSAERAATAQCRGFRCYAEAMRAQKGKHRGIRRPAGLMQAQPGECRGSVTQPRVT